MVDKSGKKKDRNGEDRNRSRYGSFKKGCAGGPGRNPAPPELRQAKKLTAVSFQRAVNKMTSMTDEEMQEYCRCGIASQLELMVVGQIYAAKSGKSNPFNLLLDRTIGGIVRQINLKTTGTITHQIARKTPEQRRARLMELERLLTDENTIDVEPISVRTEKDLIPA